MKIVRIEKLLDKLLYVKKKEEKIYTLQEIEKGL